MWRVRDACSSGIVGCPMTGSFARPPPATERLSLAGQGNIRYRLAAPAHPCARGIRASLHIKTPYRDGTTHVIFEPLDFMRHIPVPHPFGAAFGCANRLSC